nr:uncharacterized protein LOC128685240 [Cherax quadricarinatus]
MVAVKDGEVPVAAALVCDVPVTAAALVCDVPVTAAALVCDVPVTAAALVCDVPVTAAALVCDVPVTAGAPVCDVPVTAGGGAPVCDVPVTDVTGDPVCDVRVTAYAGYSVCDVPVTAAAGAHVCDVPVTAGAPVCEVPVTVAAGAPVCDVPVTAGAPVCDVPVTAAAGTPQCDVLARLLWEYPYHIVPRNHDPYNVALFNKTSMFHPDTTEVNILHTDQYIHLVNTIYQFTKGLVYNLLALLLGPVIAFFWGIVFASIVFIKLSHALAIGPKTYTAKYCSTPVLCPVSPTVSSRDSPAALSRALYTSSSST